MTTSARILVIEDNPANLKLMLYLLRAYGYSPESARDGVAGLEAARAESFALIVCDVDLPKLDGYGVLRELKRDEARRGIPVIAVTALAMVGDRDRMLAAGFDGYISKPLDPETFVQQIESFLPPAQCSTSRPIQTARPVSAPRIPTPSKEITILIVDDTSANVGFARSVLEPLGYTVVTTRSVQEALALISTKPPALILSDLHMPGDSGCDFLKLAQTDPTLRDIPLMIISSTFTGGPEKDECLALGAAGFVQRPIGPEALLDRIESALENRKPALL
ncbi:MAG: two-component system, cell cycle response regulator [Chthoniobacter sp.]|nr:two-component system, cell cycle response regulator [Chthoniobacter sp.]